MSESVSMWIHQLKDANDSAVGQLWDRYFARLTSLARRNLGDQRIGQEGEDVALSAFKSFCIRAKDGKFPKLDDRDDLWRILVTIVIRKAHKVAKKQRRVVVTDVQFFEQEFLSAEPTPAMALQMRDELDRLLTKLDDEVLRQTALWKLEAYTNREIAERFGRSVTYVERKLHLIRKLWADENPT